MPAPKKKPLAAAVEAATPAPKAPAINAWQVIAECLSAYAKTLPPVAQAPTAAHLQQCFNTCIGEFDRLQKRVAELEEKLPKR